MKFCPTNKDRFKSEDEAYTAVRRIETEDGLKMRVYRCDTCGGYHLSGRKQHGEHTKPR